LSPGGGAIERDRPAGAYLVILGTAQDGGCPQAGCRGPCCAAAWDDPARRRLVACAAVVDPATGARWMIDATPDFRDQLRILDTLAPAVESPGLAGIFLTHAHVGHYAGLLHLGREVIGARSVPVYAMPRMAAFLRSHAPWRDLVAQGNIALRDLADGVPVTVAARTVVAPFAVPHRDEHSETVGFRIRGPRRGVVYLPDIDGWEAWEAAGNRVEDVVTASDAAYLDGTFYSGGDLPERSIAGIPHPLIEATIRRLVGLPADQRAKVRFIHLNHSNPVLVRDGVAARAVAAAGFGLAEALDRVDL